MQARDDLRQLGDDIDDRMREMLSREDAETVKDPGDFLRAKLDREKRRLERAR